MLLNLFQDCQPQGSSSSGLEEHSHSIRQATPSATGSTPELPKNQEWHVGFAIPELEVFSTQVLNAINTGVVTASARREIVQILRTYVLAHTKNPKSEHYNTVCRKLVEKYPKLQDTEGDSHYVRTYLVLVDALMCMPFISYNIGLMED